MRRDELVEHVGQPGEIRQLAVGLGVGGVGERVGAERG